MRIFIAFACCLLAAGFTPVRGQYVSSQNYNLGALYGYGRSLGPAVDQSALFGQGTYHTRTHVFAFAFHFNTVRHKMGLGLGPVFSMALGGSADKYMGENLGGGWSNIDGVWGSGMSLVVDWKIGASLNYCLPDKQTTFGIRYFNWYQSNCFGGTYSNADDAAALGITVNYKKFGFGYSYGSPKIPGVLVNSHSWSSSELEARYQVKYNSKTKGGIIVGCRSLSQKLLKSAQNVAPDTRGNLISAFVLFH